MFLLSWNDIWSIPNATQYFFLTSPQVSRCAKRGYKFTSIFHTKLSTEVPKKNLWDEHGSCKKVESRWGLVQTSVMWSWGPWALRGVWVAQRGCDCSGAKVVWCQCVFLKWRRAYRTVFLLGPSSWWMDHSNHSSQVFCWYKDFLATLRFGSFAETPLTARSSALRRFSWMSRRPKSENPTRKKSKNRFPCFIVGWFQDTMRVMYTFCIGIYSIYSMHFFRSLFQDGTWYHFTGECWIQVCWNFLSATVTTVLVGQLFVWEGTEDMGSIYGPFCHNLWHL